MTIVFDNNEKKIIIYAVIINGIYDVICCLIILKTIPFEVPILSNLHLSVIKNYEEKNEIFKRFYAYWIFTYGIMRIFGNNKLRSISYFIEAMFFMNETIYFSVYQEKTFFVITLCLFLSLILLYC